ncbi:hypothetical protein HN803_05015 [candidate division WWE3 bacterium]|jgi:hypothetical protein|nr:hypothetical protein [candidate division WWE3 bacterium]
MAKFPLTHIKIKAKVDSIIDGLTSIEAAYIDEIHEGVYIDKKMSKEYESLEWQKAQLAWETDQANMEDERETILKEIESRLKSSR